MMTLVTVTARLTTSELWTATHQALLAGEIAKARVLLDDLGRRLDVCDLLPDAVTYGVRGPVTQCIQDRIDLVNAHVEMADC